MDFFDFANLERKNPILYGVFFGVAICLYLAISFLQLGYKIVNMEQFDCSNKYSSLKLEYKARTAEVIQLEKELDILKRQYAELNSKYISSLDEIDYLKNKGVSGLEKFILCKVSKIDDKEIDIWRYYKIYSWDDKANCNSDQFDFALKLLHNKNIINYDNSTVTAVLINFHNVFNPLWCGPEGE